MLTYLIIFLIVIVPYVKIKKRAVLLELKYDFLFSLHNPEFTKKDILSLEKKYPYFYGIIKKIYDVGNLNATFEEIKNSSKSVDQNIRKELDKELDLISSKGKKEDKRVLRWYLFLSFDLYFYKNPYKYMFFNFISKILPKKQYERIEGEEKEKIKQQDLCMV